MASKEDRRPSNFDDNFVSAVLEENPRQSTRDIAEKLNA